MRSGSFGYKLRYGKNNTGWQRNIIANIGGAIPKDCEIRYILLTSNVSFTKKAIGLCALVIYNINEKTYGLVYSKLGPREENRIEILKEAKFLETVLIHEKIPQNYC